MVYAMRKTLVLFAVLLAMICVGCNGSKPTTQPRLPRHAVEYLDAYGLKDCIASYEYKKDYRWSHPLLGYHSPDKCWIAATNDSTVICFSKSGNWLYTVTKSRKEDLPTKYLTPINNIDRMLNYLRLNVGDDIRIVGVSKEKDHWIIAAYPTHQSWMSEPRYYYFQDDGSYSGTKIIV